MSRPVFPNDPEALRRWLEREGEPRMPGLLGMEIVELGRNGSVVRCDLDRHHHAPNGYLAAAVLVALADTAAGYGCLASLPDGATGFTTLELKSNHTGTVLKGGIRAEAHMIHGGRTTQVWDAVVRAEDGDKNLALFRCTQLLLY